MRVTTQKKNVVPDTGETEEKHTLPSNFPAGFFPPHFGVKRAPALRIYFYIQMLWIAPGKGRPFSQQEELILFECSLWGLKRRNFATELGRFMSENPTTAR